MFSIQILRVGLPLLILAGLTGCGSGNMSRNDTSFVVGTQDGRFQQESKSADYVIRPGDVIRLEVWGYPEFNAQTQVTELGRITIPHIGELTASGLNVDAMRKRVREGLSEYIQGDVQFSLIVTSESLKRVTIIGAVTNQENYPLLNEVPLLEALAMAGGVVPESDLRQVRILRPGLADKPIVVDLTYYVDTGKYESIPIVRPGDTILVPRNENVVRELSVFLRDVIFLFGFFQLFD